MNIYDISKKAGVSIATVSRVINGNTNVSDKTRAKVLEIIKESGYTPNAFARGLGLDTMQTIGILCADCSDPYLARAIFLLERELQIHNYDSILCCTGYQLETKKKRLNLLMSKRVDAIIMVGSNFVEIKDEDNNYIRQAAKQMPIMILNGSLEGDRIYSILCDDYRAMYDATTALLDSNHKNILYLYNSLSYSGLKKAGGFKAALESRNIPIREDYIQYIEGSITDIKKRLIKLYEKGITMDGIITADDNLAIGALKFAKAKNLSVPDDIAIIGYNNSLITECCDPELTSIDNKLECVTKNCINSLMGVFAGEDIPLKTIFSAELVKRNTTSF